MWGGVPVVEVGIDSLDLEEETACIGDVIIMVTAGRTSLLSEKNVSEKNRRRSRCSPTADTGIAVLRDLSSALESVLFLIEAAGTSRREVAEGIDFYDEVRRFEIALIKQALQKTHGTQVRAAALLNLKVTTLNAKIKQYSIETKMPSRLRVRAGSLRVANE